MKTHYCAFYVAITKRTDCFYHALMQCERVNKIESGDVNALSSVIRVSGIPVGITDDPMTIIIKTLAAIELSNPIAAIADVLEHKTKTANDSNANETSSETAMIIDSSTPNPSTNPLSNTQTPNKNATTNRTFFVTLSNHSVKQAVIRRMIDKKKLTVKDVFNINDEGRIYINEMYDKDTYQLFLKVRELAKKNGYKYPWVKGNNIYVKRDNNSVPIIIQSMDDLKLLRKVND